MTRDEIIDKICPSDAITDCCSGECLFGCDDCSLTLGFILDEYDKQIRAEERKKIINILDNADDNAQAMYLLGQYIITEELKENK